MTARVRRPAAASAYWREVRQRVDKPKGALDWVERLFVGAVVVGLFWYAFGRDKALEQLAKTGIVAVSGAVVAAVFVVIRLARAAFEIHQEDLKNINAIEEETRREYMAKTDILHKRIEALESEKRDLTTQLAGHQEDQALADFLTEQHGIGIAEILNKPPRDQAGVAAWRAKERSWRENILEKMREHGCTLQDPHQV